jgi:hypothetical protein
MGNDLLLWIKEERGVTFVVVALLIIILVGVAALAIDIGHLFIVRNELQNAADAGALAGARFLYLYEDVGEYVNEDANQIAHDAAIANRSEGSPVEVLWNGGNTGDVERGHWSFTTLTFTPNDYDYYTHLCELSPEQLDAKSNFINAIRVRTRRQNTPAVSIFARVFGFENFLLSAESIAYLGFPGTLTPGEVDQPIAICKETLSVNEVYTCVNGWMISMGEYVTGQETGGWTDFNQDNPNGTNPLTVTSLVTQRKNPDPIILGQPMGMNGGDIPSAFTSLRNLWVNVTDKKRPWRLALPVIECPGNNLSSSERVVGTVVVDILWITGENDDSSYSDAPKQMDKPHSGDTWSSSNSDGHVRWNSFVQYFNLKKLGGSAAPYRKKTVYFTLECHHQKPKGRTGGENFGILAKIPVLVR